MEVAENNKNINDTVEEKDLYKRLEKVILDSNISSDDKSRQISKLAMIKAEPVNILFLGSTGVGKSSTINALFNMEKAKVGDIDPETEYIEEYQLDNIHIWDTPGSGDEVEKDKKHMSQIKAKLSETLSGGNALIDLAVIIIDAGQRDLKNVYDCINNILIPVMGKDEAGRRTIIAMNKADTAMGGRHWLRELNSPDVTLTEYLDRKAQSVKRRLHESTGINILPLYYCAGYKEGNEAQLPPYNLIKLLYKIIETLPLERRIAMVDQINPEKEHWLFSDKKMDYAEKILSDLWDSVCENAKVFADYGMNIGIWVMGAPGGVLGTLIGGAIGAVVGTAKYLIA